MATDQVVSSKDVLDAIMRVRRLGVDSSAQELERQEPDLAEIVLEEITLIHRRLSACGLAARDVRRSMHRIESLVLVAIAAVRQGYRRLWDGPLPPLPAEPPPSPPVGGKPSPQDPPSAVEPPAES